MESPQTAVHETVEEEIAGLGRTDASPDADAVRFSTSETVPLGFTNQLLRKAAYGFGLFSFLSNGFSGIMKKNPFRIAAGFGNAAVNITSFAVKDRHNPLPEGSMIYQAAQSLLKPQENALFFNRAWSFITNILTFCSGAYDYNKNGGKPVWDAKKGTYRRPTKEMERGAYSVVTGGIEIAGLSNQDKREKLSERGNLTPEEAAALNPSLMEKVFANRWVSLGSSAIRAGMMVQEGRENQDRHQLAGGIFYCLAVLSLLADHVLMEHKIKQVRGEHAR